MDADGTCLVVSPCNNCRINKVSVGVRLALDARLRAGRRRKSGSLPVRFRPLCSATVARTSPGRENGGIFLHSESSAVVDRGDRRPREGPPSRRGKRGPGVDAKNVSSPVFTGCPTWVAFALYRNRPRRGDTWPVPSGGRGRGAQGKDWASGCGVRVELVPALDVRPAVTCGRCCCNTHGKQQCYKYNNGTTTTKIYGDPVLVVRGGVERQPKSESPRDKAVLSLRVGFLCTRFFYHNAKRCQMPCFVGLYCRCG